MPIFGCYLIFNSHRSFKIVLSFFFTHKENFILSEKTHTSHIQFFLTWMRLRILFHASFSRFLHIVGYFSQKHQKSFSKAPMEKVEKNFRISSLHFKNSKRMDHKSALWTKNNFSWIRRKKVEKNFLGNFSSNKFRKKNFSTKNFSSHKKIWNLKIGKVYKKIRRVQVKLTPWDNPIFVHSWERKKIPRQHLPIILKHFFPDNKYDKFHHSSFSTMSKGKRLQYLIICGRNWVFHI